MSMLDDLINEETKKFASNPENYESIFKMAKRQKQEAQRNLDNEREKYGAEISPIEDNRAIELKNSYPQGMDQLEKRINRATDKAYSASHFWLTFLLLTTVFVVIAILCKNNIGQIVPTFRYQPVLMYFSAVGIALVFAIVYSIIVKAIWRSRLRSLENGAEVRNWKQKKQEINSKYDAIKDKLYSEKYADKIRELERELERQTEFYENARTVLLKYKHGNTLFIYFKSMKHSWTQTWCACKVKIDGNAVLYTKNDQLITVRLNDGYHSVQVIMEAKISDSVDSYTFSYQLSPNECLAFIVFDKFDLYGDPKEVSAEEFEKVSGKKIIE